MMSCHGSGAHDQHGGGSGSHNDQRWRRMTTWAVCLGLAAVAVVWLVQTGRTNILGYGLLLLCPLMHLFMHGSHGHQHEAPPRRSLPDDGQP